MKAYDIMSPDIEAAKEMARQLRLRDMGGIIVVDFIDMKKADNRRIIYERTRWSQTSPGSPRAVVELSRILSVLQCPSY